MEKVFEVMGTIETQEQAAPIEQEPGEAGYAAVLASMGELFDLEALAAQSPAIHEPADVIRDPAFASTEAARVSRLVECSTADTDGIRTFEKLELERPTGAFKEQGATWAVLQELRRHPSVRILAAPSAGNHAAAVVAVTSWLNRGIVAANDIPLAASASIASPGQNGLYEAHAFCPATASSEKTRRLQAAGAVLHDRYANEADAPEVLRGLGYASLAVADFEAQRFVNACNAGRQDRPLAALIPPFASPDVQAGQANIVLSSLVQLWQAGVDTRGAPVVWYVAGGGFGLANGSAAAAEWLVKSSLLHPGSQIVVGQMENCDSGRRGLGRLEQGDPTMDDLFIDELGNDAFDASADGTAVKVPDVSSLELAHYFVRRGRMRVELVSKAAVGRQKQRSRVRGLIVEPAGAIPGAVLEAEYLHARYQGTLKPVLYGDCDTPFHGTLVCVTSGGNESAATRDEFDAAAEAGRYALSTLVVQGHTRRPAPPVPIRDRRRRLVL